MTLAKRMTLTLCLILVSSQALLSSNKAAALYADCGWYNQGGTPWIYSEVHYSSTDATYGNALELFTQQTQPFPTSALDYWGLSISGGSAGHQASASIGPIYTFFAEGAIGTMTGSTFLPAFGTDCSASFQFTAPTALFVDITPSTVNVGDPVTITWGSQNADACLFDGAPIATSGIHNFTAALSDSRSYALQCSNLWGSSSTSATLTVN